MSTGKELVEAGQLEHIMDAVKAIDCGLVSASDIADLILDREGREQVMVDVDKPNEEALTVEIVIARLRSIIQEVKSHLKPLFEGNSNGDYFVPAKFEGQFPWQRDVPKHA